MSKFKVGDEVRRTGHNNGSVRKGGIYIVRGFDKYGDLEFVGLRDFGYNEGYFELVESAPDTTLYTPSELSYIEELQDRIQLLEELCEEYVGEIEKLKGR